MECIMCQCEDFIEGVSANLVELDGKILVVKNEPTKICEQCGYKYFDTETVKVFEQIVDEFRHSKVELQIVDYTDYV